jgi:hypothetical protein
LPGGQISLRFDQNGIPLLPSVEPLLPPQHD